MIGSFGFSDGWELARTQAPLLASILLMTGTLKIFSLNRSGANDTALALLVSKASVRRSWQVIGFTEVAVGLLILGSPLEWWPVAAAGVCFFGAAIYLAWALRAAPTKTCGCFSTRTIVSKASLLRSLLLSATALLAALPAHSWRDALRASWVWPFLVIELVGLGMLTDETRLGLRWVIRELELRRDRRSMSRMTPNEIVAALQRTSLWSSLSTHLNSQMPSDHWRDQSWRFVSFPANYEGNSATAVVGVDLADQGTRMRVALVALNDKAVYLAGEGSWKSAID